MYLVYQPEGQDEPTRWKYLPKKLRSVDREELERRSGMNFSDFTQAVVQGNSLCRRALLFMFMRRDHPKLRFDDVDFAWDELTLEYSRGELTRMREEAAKSAPAAQRAAILAELDEKIADAYDEADEGKASLPIAD
ncbi:hypothetical protein FH609_004110 [Streptomyces sp. 3MP-14]|uniref:Uncharacterized protein n=1 Tax=Streptomyces mimosae TaxID=2586635 RepID=A0A5N6A4L4_9ACTN|nr:MULTISPECIES: hypothetical protein [Streptomyces]KAB8162919.1 hypothetical protein FH607_019975 [Streptomyces mimosae]KAB8179132.1 hypothetical protein FH609_004110 [Streptomyces sp. 3MP-14]